MPGASRRLLSSGRSGPNRRHLVPRIRSRTTKRGVSSCSSASGTLFVRSRRRAGRQGAAERIDRLGKKICLVLNYLLLPIFCYVAMLDPKKWPYICGSASYNFHRCPRVRPRPCCHSSSAFPSMREPSVMLTSPQKHDDLFPFLPTPLLLAPVLRTWLLQEHGFILDALHSLAQRVGVVDRGQAPAEVGKVARPVLHDSDRAHPFQESEKPQSSFSLLLFLTCSFLVSIARYHEACRYAVNVRTWSLPVDWRRMANEPISKVCAFV